MFVTAHVLGVGVPGREYILPLCPLGLLGAYTCKLTLWVLGCWVVLWC